MSIKCKDGKWLCTIRVLFGAADGFEECSRMGPECAAREFV